jgi:hypothetical protein
MTVLVRIRPAYYRGMEYWSDTMPDVASVHALWSTYGVTICGIYDMAAQAFVA